MPLQLQTKNNSLLIKSLILVINEALEDSKSNSVIDVIFQNDVDIIQFNHDGEKLILKDGLKELIGMFFNVNFTILKKVISFETTF